MSTITYPTAPKLALTTSTQTFYTVPSTSGIVLRDAVVKVQNITSATRLVDVYGVPSGGSASTSNADAYQMAVPPYDYVLVPVSRLAASATIQSAADQDSALVLSLVSGNLYTP